MVDMIVDVWVEDLIRKHNVQDLQELPVYIIKGEIYEMKGTLMNEEAFLAGGSRHAKENIKNIKKFIKILKEVLEL
jgi:hypothetical protein